MGFERRLLIALGAIALLTLIVVASIALLQGGIGREGGGLLVVLLTPGFEDEVKKLLADDDELYVVGLGGDPHEYQLSPRDLEMLKRASIIISLGHTAVDERVKNLVERGEVKARLINILEIESVRLPELPGDHTHDHDSKNYHEPYYDPRNLVIILGKLYEVAAELRPDKREVYRGNYERLKAEIEKLVDRYGGSLSGYKAVITTAEIQPAIDWLGVSVVAIAVMELAESPSPEGLEEVLRAIREGDVIVFIAITCSGGTCKPASPLDQTVLEEARRAGVKVVEVPLGYIAGSVTWKLEYIVSQLSP